MVGAGVEGQLARRTHRERGWDPSGWEVEKDIPALWRSASPASYSCGGDYDGSGQAVGGGDGGGGGGGGDDAPPLQLLRERWYWPGWHCISR